MNIEPTELSEFIDNIRNHKPFSFSRWGDGEWNSVLGRKTGQNCDGHMYYPQMGDDLKQVLINRPTYRLGMQPFAVRQFGDRITEWLIRYGLENLPWCNADVFHRASIQKTLTSVIVELQRTKLIVVGPDNLKRLKPILPYKKFVDVPPRNAYLSMERIMRDVLSAVDGLHEHATVSISAGMPAKLLINELHTRLKGQHTLIDFGSVWDPFVGVTSRKYMRDPEHERTIREAISQMSKEEGKA